VDDRAPDFHARFGGDEFCFLAPNLGHYVQASWIGERFRNAVEQYDWMLEDARLVGRPVRIDIGIVCLRMDEAAVQAITPGLASRLIERADALMYTAKRHAVTRICVEAVRWDGSDLIPLVDTVPAGVGPAEET
jgi:diguanylate cyclase (GGDEF)-like protein